jgi:hypothetical protein
MLVRHHRLAINGESARRGIVLAALATTALLAAACGGSPSSTGSGGSPNAGGSASPPSAVAYSRCIRSHHVPRYPDPTSSGTLPKVSLQRLGVSSSQFQAAQRACGHLLPSNGGTLSAQSLQQCELTGDCPPALVRQALTEGLNFARCMRSHGVPNWPDPTIDSEGRPFFDVSAHGITHSETHSPPMSTKIGDCERLTGGGVPLG